MLAEISGVSQPGPGLRRWFADEEMDLIVWYSEAGEVSGFELCYDKSGAEHAFTWRRGGSLVHSAVDQGEALPTENRTPVLRPAKPGPRKRVADEFLALAADLEPALAALIVEALSTP